MASESPLRSKVEVERKFNPTVLPQAQLDGKYGEYEQLRRQQGDANTAWQPRGLSFFRLPDKEIKDKYVDYQEMLVNKNVWMRKRSTKFLQTADFPLVRNGKETAEWQAKVRLGGDFTASQMLEVSGMPNMKHVAECFTPGVDFKQYRHTALLTTRRKTYVVQKPFGWHSESKQVAEIRVVLDEVIGGADEAVGDGEGVAYFKHVVGEVELTAEVVGGVDSEEHNLLRTQKVVEMQGRLDEFIRRNEGLFPQEGVKGKLEAYFEWKEERNGFGVLV